MSFQKILIIGCPGSGKSTFARALRDRLGLPLYHLDMLYWNADKTTVSREVFDGRLGEVLEKDQWIIDGNFSRTMERRLQFCDTVFFLDIPTEVCLESVRGRIGTKRSDLPWMETEENEEFMEFIRTFSTERKPEILERLAKYPHVKQIVFHSRTEVDEYLKNI
ncbi:MAG: AAA family ATPase [Clostridia bacterium]|nr:AAA family ATPase [Clostridia bacterium]